MAKGKQRLNFGRQDLRKSTKFVEGDYSGINPRQFYRKLKRSIEEIQEESDFKYTTHGSQDTDLEIQSEEVGKKTGTVEGRLQAEADWAKIGESELEYRPYGPHGALGIAVGGLLFILGLGGGIEIALLGMLLLGAGVYGYWQTEMGTYPVIREDIIRVLITGEVSERTVNADGTTKTDMFANMSVIFSGDAFVAVGTDEIDRLDWPLRLELVTQVAKWRNQCIDDRSNEVEVPEGFMYMLKGWTKRSPSEIRSEINRIQKPMLDANFDLRERYGDLLRDQLHGALETELDQHEADLRSELESLAQNLNIYVEREGMQHTDNVERNQTDAAGELETDDI
ncbi:hypothetical protein [Halorubrum sp. BV1]|uniref:hypothetical protein n=1 Tax=Halorubrum sp. BV1 TaxID=1498500 RepID=UPI00067888DC|nr:hypothetical protein [Halorubrum sp. BV1]